MNSRVISVVCGGFSSGAIVSSSLMESLGVLSSTHKVPISHLLLLCVHFQLNSGEGSWDTLIASSGLSSSDGRAASTAFFLADWFDTESGVFSPPGVNRKIHVSPFTETLPSLEKKWQQLWLLVTGQPVIGSTLMGGVTTYLLSKGKSLPEPNPNLIHIFGLLHTAFSINTFLDDLSLYYPAMLSASTLSLEPEYHAVTLATATVLRSVFCADSPRKAAGNVYLFYFLASKGVLPRDITRTLKIDHSPLWVETCLRILSERIGSGSTCVNLSAIS